MRKASQVLAAAAALAICGIMTYLTVGAGQMTMLYNVGVLSLMLLIILFAGIFGFRRMGQTIKGLDRASGKLISVYQNKTEMAEITKAGAQIFEVPYLDRKYQEYLAYLRKTNSPCDIGDYIGEYEINNYTHRRLVEMVPDVLTSLGILGTFIGLVVGLRGFDPVSYEAMASSITSLIDGIKVAFVTSVYGISLSLAYTYWERDTLTKVSESLDNFLDKYYLCAVTPTDATAMNHVLANQRAQTKAIEGLGHSISQEIADSMSRQISEAMRRELYNEFSDMRALLKDTNDVQESYVAYLSKAQTQFERNLEAAAGQMRAAVAESAARQDQSASELATQREHLSQFVDYMGQAMASMSAMTEKNNKILQSLADQVAAMEKLTEQSRLQAREAQEAAAKALEAAENAGHPTVEHRLDDLYELTDRMDQMIDLMDRQQKLLLQANKNTRRGLFR